MDHYRVLQVGRHAEPEVIEKAYRALCLKYHPDKVPEARRAEATRRMQHINAAYEVLGEPASKRRYDATLPSPGEPSGGWERFLDSGLVGLFEDWMRSRGV